MYFYVSSDAPGRSWAGLGLVLGRPGVVLWRRRGVLRLLCGCETVKSGVKLSKISEDRRASWALGLETWAICGLLGELMKNYVFLCVLQCSWAFLGRSWRGLEALLGGLGASWERLERVLARLGAVLRAPRGRLSGVVWPSTEL